jgi:hypothetical protein
MAKVFGFLIIVGQMEINLGIPDDYCQGEANHLDSIDPEEYELPLEDKKSKLKSIKVKRGKSN